MEGGSSTETGFPFTVNEIKKCLLPFEDAEAGTGGTRRLRGNPRIIVGKRTDGKSAQIVQKWRLGSEFIDAVEGGDFIGFRKRRVVEDGVAEIFDGAAVIEDGLADVDDFRRALSDNVDP